MEIDAELLLLNAVRDGIREGIKAKLQASYNNPFDKLIESAITEKGAELKSMMTVAIASCLNNDTFHKEIAAGVRHTLAKTLISRFGGEMEKQVNALKSDPATRARITLAIDEIVKQKTS